MGRGDDGFFSVLDDFSDYLTGKKKGGFRKYDKVIDRTLEQIPQKSKSMPRRTTSYGQKRRRDKAMKPKTRLRPAKKKKVYKRKRVYKKKVRSKLVPLAPTTARERIVEHETKTINGTDQECLYTAYSNVGRLDYMVRMVAQTTLLHYMHRVGDFRASKTVVPGHITVEEVEKGETGQPWSKMKFQFTNVNDLQIVPANDIDEFELASMGSGVHKSLEQLTNELAPVFHGKFSAGKRLSCVTIGRSDIYGAVSNNTIGFVDRVIYTDSTIGRNIVEFSVVAKYKLQNTTAAEGGGLEGNNIKRNPIDGMVYSFKNRVPLYKMQYLHDNPERGVVDGLSEQYSTAKGGVTVPDIGGLPEFVIPPRAPSTIWRNVAGKQAVRIGAGFHKTFSDKEYYRGAINAFADRYFPKYADGSMMTVPGGKCHLIGLKAMYRNDTSERVEVQIECDYSYGCRMSKARLTPLPISSIVS